MPWRSLTPRGEAPAPCPDCEEQLEKVIKKNPKSLTIFDNMGKVEKKLDPDSLTFGTWVNPQGRTPKTGITIVGGGDPSSLSDTPYDPGVVETGNAKVTIEDALAATAAEGGGE